MPKMRVIGDEATIGGDGSFVEKMIAGTKGKIMIKTPFGERVINKIKDSKGKVLKDAKHPERVGKIER